MASFSGPEITNTGLVFYYDMSNTEKSWRGQPTTNMLVSQGLGYSLYAYVSGTPTSVSTQGYKLQTLTANRYTISSAVNFARAAFFPSSLTTNTNYVFSIYIRYNGPQTPTFYADSSKGNPEGGANNNSFNTNTLTSTEVGYGWYKLSYLFNFSSCPTGKCILAFGINTGSDANYVNQTFDVYDAQLETNSFATPYANGTRSSTQAIVDLTNNKTITAQSLTYNADGTFSFTSASSNYASIPPITLTNSSYTVESWFKRSSTGSTHGILTDYQYGWWLFGVTSSNNLIMNHARNLPTYANNSLTGTSSIGTNWTYGAATFDTAAGMRLYVNGVQENSNSSTIPFDLEAGRGPEFIGLYRDGAPGLTNPFNGSIGALRVYNTALTAAQISNNFESSRDRFGI
jgi:hypothetical protein